MNQSKKSGHLLASVIGAMALLAATSANLGAQGDDVIMYRGAPPSPEELADILFPEAVGSGFESGQTRSIKTRGLKTRGIRLTDRTEAAAAPEPQPNGFGFNIHFAFDSVEVLPESAGYLEQVGEMMKLDQVRDKAITIVGHTDASGPASYNEQLSVRRAHAIKEYLESRHGIEAERLQIAGLGEQKPLPEADPLDPTNRRVEFFSAQ
ncbi:MAG: OmpA family protein [Geminicoccaceae bacterium]